MSDLDRDALDRWITDGRYSKVQLLVTCPACEEKTPVTAETDYGATEWDPDRCRECKREFTGEETTEDDEPPEPDHHEPDGDIRQAERRYESWLEDLKDHGP